MKKRGLLTLLGSICLILILAALPFMAACPAPPEEEVLPPPEEEETPPPHEPYEIEASTIPAGFASYVIGVALAELINENSTWLRCTALEGRGPVEHLKLLVTEPEKRATYLFFNTPWEQWMAERQMGPFADFPFDYSEFKFVALIGCAANGLIVADPNIKTLEDLRGKIVITDSAPGKGRYVSYTGIFKQAGITEDDVEHQYGSGTAVADALRDGLVDAIYLGGTLVEPPNTWLASPFITELMAAKDIYFLSLPEEHIKAFAEETGFPATAATVPPGTFSPLQTEPYTFLTKHLAWCAHQDMPDDVVYEICRIIYENAEQFKEFIPAGAIITKETMATMGVPEEALHPGALKFYKEKGILITSFK